MFKCTNSKESTVPKVSYYFLILSGVHDSVQCFVKSSAGKTITLDDATVDAETVPEVTSEVPEFYPNRNLCGNSLSKDIEKIASC